MHQEPCDEAPPAVHHLATKAVHQEPCDEAPPAVHHNMRKRNFQDVADSPCQPPPKKLFKDSRLGIQYIDNDNSEPNRKKRKLDIVDHCGLGNCRKPVFSACGRCEVFMCYDHFIVDYMDCGEHDKVSREMVQRSKNMVDANQNITMMENDNQSSATVDPQNEMYSNSEHCDNAQNTSIEDRIMYEPENCNLGKKFRYKRRVNQIKRVLGRPYIGFSTENSKIYQNVSRRGKHVNARCSHELKLKHTPRSFRCAEISEETRRKLCYDFWLLGSWAEKKAFIAASVATRHKIKSRKETLKLREKIKNHDCYMSNDDGKKIRVCRKMFLSTFAIGEDQFRRWTRPPTREDRNNSSTSDPENDHDNSQTKDKVSRMDRVGRQFVADWLDKVPKVPSHYCRSSTSKVYVESTFRSYAHMHKVYCKHDRKLGRRTVGIKVFIDVLKKLKVGIHSPRKDQCDLCYGYKIGNVDQTTYDVHIDKKNEARNSKNEAKKSANPTRVVLTMDLQSVMLCPRIEASAVYYKMKLQLHNFTMYDLHDGSVSLYVWHEGNGGVTSNEFTSCIVDYITKLSSRVTSVVLVSDGACYQNRNKILSSALSNLAIRKQITIEQIILERGHTMMEVDSVHATLECLFDNYPIYAPSDYVFLMRQARPKQPYTVNSVDYSFFRDYESLPSNLSSIRPGLLIL